ncbi:MAG TPA: universal stress protein [Lacibacter sp.]|nr:universal stress protein [Lacibacter sp.]HMO90341.1 universal stress protein [Lacibacter sp.]HMP87345.1 universal stress protein [Lacibacter sp.]
MKKFLAVFDGFRFSESTASYAIAVSKAAGAHLVGIFPNDLVYRTYDIAAVYKKKERPEELLKELDEKDRKKIEQSVRRFQKLCAGEGLSFSVRQEEGLALQEVKHESMFADLLIIGEEETFSRHRQEVPTRFIRELLIDVQCPVLVVPPAYKPVDKITLLYDAGPSAVYAVKMFSYLFGDFGRVPVEVFTVKDRNVRLRSEDTRLFREFVKRHFSKAGFKVVKGEAEDQILKYLKRHKENELVVLGAYRRSEISRWFKSSMADVLMRVVDTPLFIAHNK